MKEKYFEQYDKLVEPLCSMYKERFDESFIDYEDDLSIVESIAFGWQWSGEEFEFWEAITSNINQFTK